MFCNETSHKIPISLVYIQFAFKILVEEALAHHQEVFYHQEEVVLLHQEAEVLQVVAVFLLEVEVDLIQEVPEEVVSLHHQEYLEVAVV